MIEGHASPPGPFRRRYVDDPGGLGEVVPELAAQAAVGVDVEMGQRAVRKPGGLQEWVHSLALIQIAGGDLSVVIDPLRVGDLAPLHAIFAGHARKVFLGGGQDAALLARAGLAPRHVVDVGEVALALFGRREDGMAALSRRIYGLSLDKTVRRADWLIRPLNPVLISYAHRDAELTLGIYHWFETHHPDVLHFHERAEYDPSLPDETPPWLREAVLRPSQDAYAIVLDAGLDPAVQGDQLGDDVRAALVASTAPRLVNRLLRIAADLGLTTTLPDVLTLVDSPSSMIRASVARTIGLLAEPDTGRAPLDRLAKDPIAEVQKAAEAAQRELAKPRAVPAEAEDEVDAPSLNDSALGMLEQLRARLETDDT
ncbi:MAG TPA: hypothetical protein VKX16_01115 [Chloroflexota bacterium]|nr:hypothetical protein [Chloroflexota bacterium]